MPTVELRFGALPGHVRTARLIAAAICRRVGVPADLLDEIKLAVGEACARAVAVNRRHAPDAMVVVRLTDSADQFSIEVRDAGPARLALPPGIDGLDPLGELDGQLADGDAASWDGDPGSDGDESEAPTGLGLALIEGLVDEMDIAGIDGGTAVTMRWQTAAAPLSAEPERALVEP
jgi:serine/threonine-protein kinase RsbW